MVLPTVIHSLAILGTSPAVLTEVGGTSRLLLAA